MMDGCDSCEEDPNGSTVVSLLCRLVTLVLGLTSAVVMAVASECPVVELNGGTAAVTYTQYPSFVFLVWFNILAAILEAAAMFVQLMKDSGAGEVEKLLPILVALDVAVQAMLYSSTGAAFAAASAHAGQIAACAAFGRQVLMSKLLSLFASFSISVAAVVKDVPLPFDVWPKKAAKLYFMKS